MVGFGLQMAAFEVLTERYGYSREEIYQQTEDLVKCAARHNGVVFGGYVRDVVIPSMWFGRELTDIDFKDMDFWFTKQSDAEAFTADAGLVFHQDTDWNTNKAYPVSRNQHMSTYKDNDFVIIDVMITDFFPVCDFSINLLSWEGSNLIVNKPYDILAELAKIELSKRENMEKTPKQYTIEEINAVLVSRIGGKFRYTLEEIQYSINTLVPKPSTPILLIQDDSLRRMAEYNEHFKEYNLNEIVAQISCRRFDIFEPFEALARNTYFDQNLRCGVSKRIERFNNWSSKAL